MKYNESSAYEHNNNASTPHYVEGKLNVSEDRSISNEHRSVNEDHGFGNYRGTASSAFALASRMDSEIFTSPRGIRLDTPVSSHKTKLFDAKSQILPVKTQFCHWYAE